MLDSEATAMAETNMVTTTTIWVATDAIVVVIVYLLKKKELLLEDEFIITNKSTDGESLKLDVLISPESLNAYF